MAAEGKTLEQVSIITILGQPSAAQRKPKYIQPTTEADRLPELVSSERAFGSLVLVNINFLSLS